MLYLGILLMSIIGFFISFYIFIKKKDRHRIACPFGGDCNAVIKSDYAKFFGLSHEIAGMIFFAFTFLVHLVFALIPDFNASWFLFLMLLALAIAIGFGLFLTFIQFFIIRKKCSWCILLVILAIAISLLSWHVVPISYISIMQEFRAVILIMHVGSMALGLGGATITDFFFFKFLKDLKISKYESNILKLMSEFIWVALGLAIVTGFGLFLPLTGDYLESSKFLLKMVVVGVIVVNGFFLNLFISPHLVNISFSQNRKKAKHHHHYKGELVDLRRLAFALGAISISSWYTAFILGMLRSIPLPVSILLLIYFGILILAVTGSQIAEYIMCRMQKKK